MTDLSEPNNLPQRVTRLETLLETLLPHLATKADLLELEVRLLGKIDATGTRLDGKIDTLMRWMIGLFVTMIVGFGSLGVALYNAIKP